MTEAFRFFGFRLLTVGGASLVVALALRDARRSIRLAENRMGYLREEQIRLLASLREERQSLQEELEQARERRLEAEREVERLAKRLSRENLLSQQEQGRLAEALDRNARSAWRPKSGSVTRIGTPSGGPNVRSESSKPPGILNGTWKPN
jgi:hypothetical protein